MKFLAVLKDSFREAVDGWIIYVMFIASTLFILLIGCIGYKPVAAEKAFPVIVAHFRMVSADRNHSAIHSMPMWGVTYDLKDITKLNDAKEPQEADYRLRLEVNDTNNGFMFGPDEGGKERKPGFDPDRSAFRKAVAFWSGPGDFERGRNADPKTVKEEDILAFVKDLFEFNGNLVVTKVERVPEKPKADAPKPPAGAPTPPPETTAKYEFIVETKGQKGVRGWLHEPTMFFGAFTIPLEMSLGQLIYLIQGGLINGVGAWIALLVGVVLTAFFIPNMMRKGSIDLMLSKPMHRASLLIYKYIGGLTFVFLNTAYAVGGVWLVMGLRSGVWSFGFLFTIFAITFYFAILYAVSTLLGVLSRNAIVAILGTVAFWFTMWIVGQIYSALDLFRHEADMKDRIPSWVYTISDTANAVLPRTTDLNKLTGKLVVQDTLGEGDKRQAKLDNLTWPSWGEVLGVSFAHIAIMLGLAVWRFTSRDY